MSKLEELRGAIAVGIKEFSSLYPKVYCKCTLEKEACSVCAIRDGLEAARTLASSACCAWCGAVYTYDITKPGSHREQMKLLYKHATTCEKSPLTILLNFYLSVGEKYQETLKDLDELYKNS